VFHAPDIVDMRQSFYPITSTPVSNL